MTDCKRKPDQGEARSAVREHAGDTRAAWLLEQQLK